MIEEPRIHRVEVSFVGTPPARQVERASGVSEVAVEGSILRCLVCGSFQPFIEALGGHEVVDFTSVPTGELGAAQVWRTRRASGAREPDRSAAHTPAMAEMSGFTPSVNRSIIAGIPDLPDLPAGLRGARAFDWLSSVGIARRVRERLPGIDLAPVPDGPGPDVIIAARPYPRALDAMVTAGDATATALADDLGVALAGLVAMLVLGPPDARAARPDWPAEHWERWAAVRRIGLGGGIASGALGSRLVASATAWLPRLGAGEVRLRLADDPGSLAMLGAATRLPDGRAVLVDAGLTWIKRGLATVHDGRCVTLTTMAAVTPPLGPRAGAFADFLADAAADVVRGSSVSSAGFAVAVDVDPTGQPLAGQPGLYGSLGMVPLARWLADRLGDRLGYPVTVQIVNDGDAAAAAMAGEADAVIMLGTAIGVGLNV